MQPSSQPEPALTESKPLRDELRTSAAQLAAERDRLTLLLEINNHIVSKLEADELFHAVAQSMRKHFGSDLTSFLLVNQQSGSLERKFLDFPAGKGFLEKAPVTVPTDLLREWWRRRIPVFYSPVDTDIPPVLREADRRESLLSAVSVPLVGANGPLGLLNIASQRPNAFSEADRDLLSQIGTQISLALDNALAYRELQASHDALRRGEAYLREAQRLTHAGTWAHDGTGQPLYWSEELFRNWGFDPQHGVPTRDQIVQRVYPDDLEKYWKYWHAVYGPTAERIDLGLEFRAALPGGVVKHLHEVAHPILNGNGDVVEVVGATVDITERKRAEEQLRRTAAYMADAEKLARTGAWASDAATQPLYWSDEVFRIFGFAPQQGLPSWDRPLQRIHADDRKKFWQAFQKVIQDKVDVEVEYRVVLPDQTVKCVYAAAHPVLNQNGEFVEAVGTIVDITERKRAEAALRRSEAYLAEAQRLTHTGSWALDVTADKYIYCSEECLRLYGFNPQAGLPTREAVFRLVVPEDLERVTRSVEKSIRERVDTSDEFRIQLRDGTLKQIHSIRHPVVNDAGEVVELVGTSVDITERKRAEEALREKEEGLRLAASAAQLGVFEWDIPSDAVRWQNVRMFDMFGRTPTEGPLNREAFNTALEPDDRPAFDKALIDAMGSADFFNLACRIRRQNDGQQRWIELSGCFELAPDGSPKRLLGVVADVTERKRGEEAVRESEKQLRDLIENIPVMAYIARPDGSTEFVNRRWREYTGVTAEKTGFYRQNTVHPEDREVHIAKWQVSLATGEPFENEVRHCGDDGEYRWFLTRAVPLRDVHGNVLKWFGTVTDIEDRKKAEEKLRTENVALREDIDKASMFEDVVGASPALRSVLAAVSKVAPMHATVLITGETGTGKELIARAIHKNSLRSSGPFVSVNCAAIPQSLLASELFGHEKGAFTGAVQRRIGRFELAEGGTIFLDEVGDFPLDTQIALLRVLQEKEFERVGGAHTIRSDARIIAATNRNLETAIAAGTFRSDLFYRLSVFPIRVPPLRERREDISLLVEYFIDRFARKANKRITKIEKKTLQLLQSFSWPGNVRELQNLIERAVIICESDTLTVDQSWLSFTAPQPPAPSESLARKSAAEEREIIERALSEAHGKVAGPSGAAAKLGIPPSTLESKIRLLKIDKYHHRKPPAFE